MMNNIISSRLKELRKINNLSQKNLAEGICTQAVISNIEKGEVIPSSIILYKIAQKLNVDINYFFDESVRADNLFRMEDIKILIRSLVRKKDYHSVSYIVNNELNNNTLNNCEDLQFLKWHEGICEYYVNSNFENALKILYSSLNCSNIHEGDFSNQEIGILNSIAVIYYEIKDFNKSIEVHELCLEKIKSSKTIDPITELRVLYGVCRTLTSLGQIDNSIYYCKQGIQKCIQQESIYLLGEFHFQIARNLIMLDKIEESTEYLNITKTIFKLQNNQSFLNITEKVAAEIIK